MFLNKFGTLYKYVKVFSSINDIKKFRSLFSKTKPAEVQLFGINVRAMRGKPQYCRIGTTDYRVLWDTFYDQYHLPPVVFTVPNPVVIDLGVNVGFTMAHFASLYREASIFGVEMDKENYNVAIKNIEHFGSRCKLINAAVWDENGVVTYDDDGEGEWGFRISTESKSKKGFVADAKTLDSIFEEFKIDEVDYVKMDIEGAEQRVLANPGKWISKVKAIKIEVHAPFTINQCMDVLEKNGFIAQKDLKHPFAVIGIRK